MIAKNVMFGVVLAVTWSAQLVGATDKDEQKSAKMLAQVCAEYLASPTCSARFQKFMLESIQEIRGTLINRGYGDSSKLMDEIIADIHILRGALKQAHLQQLSQLTPEKRDAHINNTLSLEEHEQICALSICRYTGTTDHTVQEAMQRLQKRYELLDGRGFRGFRNAAEPSREWLNIFEKIFFDVDHTA
jgi:hypothetical protein